MMQNLKMMHIKLKRTCLKYVNMFSTFYKMRYPFFKNLCFLKSDVSMSKADLMDTHYSDEHG